MTTRDTKEVRQRKIYARQQRLAKEAAQRTTNERRYRLLNTPLDATIVFKRTQDFLFDDEAEAPRASKTFSFKRWLALYRPNMKYPEGNHIIGDLEWIDRKAYCEENNLCFITLRPLRRDVVGVIVGNLPVGTVPLKRVGTSLIPMVLA
jgi:hypothetical protein